MATEEQRVGKHPLRVLEPEQHFTFPFGGRRNA